MSFPPYVPKPKSRLDRIYGLIEEASLKGWCFTDKDGRPWIQREDLEERDGGVVLVRFTCSLSAMHSAVLFEKMASEVCGKLHSGFRYVYKPKEAEYPGKVRLFYNDCVWIISEDELSELDFEDNGCESCIDSQEEIQGELVDNSTQEEVDERFENAMEEFV